MSVHILPPVYVPVPCPSYSAEPTFGESRLDYRRRPINVSNDTSDGIFIHKRDNITVVLNNLQKSGSRPSYGRRGVIAGSLLFDRPRSITSVSVKLIGILDCYTISGADAVIRVCDNSYTLYQGDRDHPTLSDEALPFSFPIPSTFEYQEMTYPLPPSYKIEQSDTLPLQSVRCKYQFVVTVSRARRSALAFLGNSTDSFSIDIDYYPRFRPSRPILQDPCFSSSIKYCPEEWRQTFFEIPVQALDPISCQLFLPSVGVFALQDSIPFYLQLTAPISSLRLLTPTATEAKPCIRVYLLRQVTITINKEKIPRHFVLGEAKINALPPVLSPEDNLNWEGEVRCTDIDLLVGGFDAGLVSVQDFLTLEVSYHIPGSLPVSQKRGVPIKLVTDSWSDTSTG
ncbi:hypothetical protein C8J56DRAFT_437382 [Mycena floridula]|nr:hypothetical protein C8J56DRAFT_437382 [Mycena floridula]